MFLRAVNSFFRQLFAILGMLFVLFEELLWVLFGGLFRRLAVYAPVAYAERWIRRLPPIWALPLFVLPWLVMLPVKIGALWLIAMGKVIKGVLLFIGGEAFGALFLARLYELCRPALHQWRWFVIVEGILLRWTLWAHRVLRTLPPVRMAEDGWEQRWQEIKRRLDLWRQRIRPPEL